MATETISETKIGCIVLDEELQIPLGIQNLADFRAWAYSDEFPEKGRIDFIGHRIEVTMSPEELASHGSPKVEILRVFANLNKGQKLGEVYVDRARISSPTAELSAEPDIVFVLRDTLKSGRARKIPKASQEHGRFIEIEGAVDLVVEVISDSSVTKDRSRLPPAYFEAGVQEFWLVDARRDDLFFQIHHRGETAFQPVPLDEEGFQRSNVLDRRYRLEREPDDVSDWIYDLLEAE